MATPTPPFHTDQNQQRQQISAPPPPPTGQNIAPSGAFPGSLTPGWNDPPPISADVVTSTANSRRPRLDLRKRVAHPIDSVAVPQPPDVGSPRPVAMVTPNRQIQQPNLNNIVGGIADAGGFVGGGEGGPNANSTRLPPLGHAAGIDSSKVPVAMITPMQK
ncbi:uncharacterized protein LOC108103431 [Drosophila eugracilis]|uniref:uncharacterized protein LOC108103431 n=1 Tax=Drosophila eugracilis TaxID=29029 RepID=UPI0007E85E3D|nr:uncharacterized protein LOC108103431 [Drosophila eugracilis]